MIDIQELKAKAEAAEIAQNTQPYLANMESNSFNQIRLHAHQRKQLDTMFALHALCTPQAILELIARLERYREALELIGENDAAYAPSFKVAREALKNTP